MSQSSGVTFGTLQGDRRDQASEKLVEDVVDERELAEEQQTFEEHAIAGSFLTLPGMGEKPGDCGDYLPLEFCDECAELGFLERQCKSRDCPDCWEIWTAERTQSAVERLTAYRLTRQPRIVHATVSPESGTVQTLADIDRYRSKAQELAREHGMGGGACVFHPWRVLPDVKEEIPGDEEQQWQYVRENDKPWREQVYWSPHWHIIGPCMDFKADTEENGWTVRRLSAADRIDSVADTESYESVAGMVRYVLSHAGYEEEKAKDAITWFGAAHPTQFVPDEELPEATVEKVEAVAEAVVGLDHEKDDSCPCSDCSGGMVPMCRARSYLQRSRWCESISAENEERLVAAREWIVGDRVPPPGRRHPKTAEQSHEAFEHLL